MAERLTFGGVDHDDRPAAPRRDGAELGGYGKSGAAPAANAGGFELLHQVAGKHRAAVAREMLLETERPPGIEPGEQPRGGVHADLREGRRHVTLPCTAPVSAFELSLTFSRTESSTTCPPASTSRADTWFPDRPTIRPW